MEICDFNKHIHFIGAGGISVSALIKLSLKLGAKVTGSDAVGGSYLDCLNSLGAKIYVGSRPEAVKSADLVVYSLAIPETDPEMMTARELDIPMLNRAQYLGNLSTLYDKIIAVSGTHGKTTTTALISAVCKNALLHCSAHIGGEVKDLGGNYYFNGFDYFITEACEYKKSLLELCPDYGVILNVESDHPDCYKTLSELYDTFNNFLSNTLVKNGIPVINGDSKYFKTLKSSNYYSHMQSDAYDSILTFGLEHTNTCYAVNLTEKNGLYSFDVMLNNCLYGHINSTLYGHHNIYNLLCSVLVCAHIGIDKYVILDTLNKFSGVSRRFENLGEINGASVILDYAHHPSEIVASIEAAKHLTTKKLIVYFQPHTYSRTDKYFDDFIESLLDADELHLVKTFPARETPVMGRSAKDLYEAILKRKKCIYHDDIKEAEASLYKAQKNQLILLLGAGDFIPKIN